MPGGRDRIESARILAHLGYVPIAGQGAHRNPRLPVRFSFDMIRYRMRRDCVAD